MSNQIKNMHKIASVPDAEELRARELQKQAYVVNTRFQLSQTFLNTMLARPDADLADPENVSALTGIAVDFANELMTRLGLTGKTATND